MSEFVGSGQVGATPVQNGLTNPEVRVSRISERIARKEELREVEGNSQEQPVSEVKILKFANKKAESGEDGFKATFEEFAKNGFKNFREDEIQVEVQHEQDRKRFEERREQVLEGVLFDAKSENNGEGTDNILALEKVDEVLEEQEGDESVDVEAVKEEALERYEQEMAEAKAQSEARMAQMDQETLTRVTQLEQQVAAQKTYIESLSANLEKTQESLSHLSELSSELQQLLAEMEGEDEEDKKKHLMDQIMKLASAMVLFIMNSMIDPDKAQQDIAENMKQNLEEDVPENEEDERKQRIVARIQEYKQAVSEQIPQESVAAVA